MREEKHDSLGEKMPGAATAPDTLWVIRKHGWRRDILRQKGLCCCLHFVYSCYTNKASKGTSFHKYNIYMTKKGHSAYIIHHLCLHWGLHLRVLKGNKGLPLCGAHMRGNMCATGTRAKNVGILLLTCLKGICMSIFPRDLTYFSFWVSALLQNFNVSILTPKYI